MKQEHRLAHCILRLTLAATLLTTLAIWQTGCDDGRAAPGVGLANVSQAAPRLPERDPETSDYRPYYGSADMNRPRYLHEAVFSRNGLVYVFGGSDERGLSSLDSVEFFDQAAIDKDAVEPETLTGVWFDTNFEGDTIVFEGGPRVLFTVSTLSDGTMIIIGGTVDLGESAQAFESSEIFDPEMRMFEEVESDMEIARFRHQTVQLFDGNFLIIGGQDISAVTVLTQGEIGQPPRQENRTVFQSVEELEVFSVTTNEFEIFTFPNQQNREVTLNTPRGRAGHGTVALAGFDQVLDTGDDLFVIAGGYQTLSGSAAPQTKLPGIVRSDQADALTVIEFFDPVTSIVTQAGNVSLQEPRIEFANMANLGQFNDFTIDGVAGMGNAILITGGHDDDGPNSFRGRNSEVLVATYSGFGPAQGLQFFNVNDLQTLSQVQGVEFELGAMDPLDFQVGRAMTNVVSLPRRLVTAPNVPDIGTWVFALAGVSFGSTGQRTDIGDEITEFESAGVIRSGCVFDPFYNLRGASILGVSARDLDAERTLNNPLGIVGTWLTLDGEIPTTDLLFFASTPASNWARTTAGIRVLPKNIAIPGEDGIIDTPDDRILLSGGGVDPDTVGGEPTAPSTEVFLPPGVNSGTPSD